MMEAVVSGLEGLGFGVSQQETNDRAEKIVGYEVIRYPASFRLPMKKMLLLRDSLHFVAGRRQVRIRVLHALVGVWVFGALLRRELLSIPQTVFSFLSFHEEHNIDEACWWKSAREEVLAMAKVTCLMSCHVGPSCQSGFLQQMLWGPMIMTTGDMALSPLECPLQKQQICCDKVELKARPLHDLMGHKGRDIRIEH